MIDSERVAARWDQSEWAEGVPKDYWGYHPLINDYINATIMPGAHSMLDWFQQRFLPAGPCQRALSIGCGAGRGDRQALLANACHFLEGFDISPGSIAIARREAEKMGLSERLHYWVTDANTLQLEKGRYDLALAFGALHHIEALEPLCAQLRQALKPDSYIFVNEYVGPARFQWTAEQLDIINRVLALIPARWRRAEQVKPPAIAEMIAADPSEAVRSDEIITILCQNFEVVDYCDYGGGLLMPLWTWGVLPDVFLKDNQVDKQVIIKLLILLDELLAEHQLVSSNYVQLVLRNRRPPAGQAVARRLSYQSPDRHKWSQRWLPGTSFTKYREPRHRKAWRILRHQGPRALIREAVAYWRWRRSAR